MLYKISSFAVFLFLYACSGHESEKATITGSQDSMVNIQADFPDLMNMDSLQKSHSSDSDAIRKIDTIVRSIDNDQQLFTRKFSIAAVNKPKRIISYEYKEKAGTIRMIRRQFADGKDTVVHFFYLEDNQLIYAVESITTSFSKDPQDKSHWSGYYYFSNGKMFSHLTLGHGKSEGEDPWDPEQEMLRSLKESRRDIERAKMKAKGQR